MEEIHQTCRNLKEEAQARYTFPDPKVKNDSGLAINAFDELEHAAWGPSFKRQKFEKARQTALKIVSMIGDHEYRKQIEKQIQNLNL